MAQAVRTAVQQTRIQQRHHILGRDRPVGNATQLCFDFHQGLQPEQAPRAVAHQIDRQPPLRAFAEQQSRDLVSPDRQRGRITGHIHFHRTHAATSTVERTAARRSDVTRANTRSFTCMAGDNAHKPRQ